MNTLKNKLLAFILLLPLSLFAQQSVNEKPRILISTDIGGTDPDDNQSMMHYLLTAMSLTAKDWSLRLHLETAIKARYCV